MWKSYKNQLGEPKISEFISDIQSVEVDEIPVVDKELALKLADKKLGDKPSLGSQVYLGEPTIQNVAGELVWVVPLHHSGFFKWIKNIDGTPGYIVVSATDPQEYEYVDGFNVKIQPDSYFFDDLERRARFGDAMFTGITDYSFEINDDGKPYWVVTTYKCKSGFALREATGVILVDAENGSMERYSIDNVPEWVDRVQPEELIMEQINNRGKYIKGIFNFSNQDKFQSSEGNAVIYKDGRCYLFTGITSVGRDESAIGFMLVDLLTKESYQYNMAGATEYAAMNSAEGKVQQFKYTASFPIILNVDNQPTYFMTLKDAEGLIKQYALVSAKEYALVGVGDTVNQAIKNYQKVLNTSSSLVGTDKEEDLIKLSGIVKRIASEYNDGITLYSIILEENPNMIFICASTISAELPLTVSGDKVEISYYDMGSNIIKSTKFDNLEFTQE